MVDQWRPTTRRPARLNFIHHLLGQMPYHEIPRPEVVLPARERHEDGATRSQSMIVPQLNLIRIRPQKYKNRSG